MTRKRRFLALAALALGLWLTSAMIRAATGSAAANPGPTASDQAQELQGQLAEDPHGQAGQGTEPHGHGDVSTNPLELKRDLALWTAVVFLVLLGVLGKFAWGPIAQGLQRREQGIANQIAQAEQANQQAQEMLGQYQQKLAGAQEEVRGMLEQARRDAEQAGRELVERARQEAQTERQRSLEQIDAATAQAIKELASFSADLAVELAGKIVRAELKPEDHAVLIRQTMADLARRSPSHN